MDISRSKWQKFGLGNRGFKDTVKAFYGKYLYKATVRINGASLLRYALTTGSATSFYSFVQRRKDFITDRLATSARGVNPSNIDAYLSSWDRPVYNSDAIKLYKIYQIIARLPGTFRFRLESNNISIFFESPAEMCKALESIHAIEKGLIQHIWQPVNDEAKESLMDDVIYMKNPTHKFRVTIAEKIYDSTVHEQIIAYAKNHPDNIKLSKSMTRQHSNRRYMRGYYYVNNTEVLLFLKLISPDFVKKIFRVEQAA